MTLLHRVGRLALAKYCMGAASAPPLILENFEVKGPLVANFYFIPAPLHPPVRTNYKKAFLGINTSSIEKKLMC